MHLWSTGNGRNANFTITMMMMMMMRDYTVFVVKDCSSERKRDRQTDGQI